MATKKKKISPYEDGDSAHWVAAKPKKKKTAPKESAEVTQWKYEQKHPTKSMRDEKETGKNIKKWEQKNGVKMDQNAWSDHPTPIRKSPKKKISTPSDAHSSAKYTGKGKSKKKIVTTKR